MAARNRSAGKKLPSGPSGQPALVRRSDTHKQVSAYESYVRAEAIMESAGNHSSAQKWIFAQAILGFRLLSPAEHRQKICEHVSAGQSCNARKNINCILFQVIFGIHEQNVLTA